MLLRKKFAFGVLGAAATAAFVAAPYRITLNGLSAELLPQTAAAKDKGNGGGSGKGGNSGNNGNAGNGGNNGKGNGGNNGQGGKGNAGNGKGDKGGAGNNDAQRNVRDQPRDDFGRRGNGHINPATGDQITISGANIEVVHPNGIKEEVGNGRYEMNDAKGRTIIRRRATEADRARLRAMID